MCGRYGSALGVSIPHAPGDLTMAPNGVISNDSRCMDFSTKDWNAMESSCRSVDENIPTTAASSCSHEREGVLDGDHDVEQCRQIVESVQSATTTKQRLMALRSLETALNRPEFGFISNHVSFEAATPSRTKEIKAAVLLRAGILNSIAFQLHVLIHRHGSALEETRLICRCLALLCELCNSVERELVPAFEKLGVPFLRLLTEIFAYAKQQEATSHTHQMIGPEISLSLLKVLNGLSACPSGALFLQKCANLVQCLVSVISNVAVHTNVALESLSALKNLTYYEEDSRLPLLAQHGFYTGIANLSVRSHVPTKILQRISSILKNLTVDAECRSQLTRQPTVASALVRLALTTQRNRHDEIFRDDLERLKRNVLDVLVALLMDDDFGLVLILHGDGVLLDILRRFLDSSDESIRKRASTAIRLVTRDVAIPIIVQNLELMQTLTEASLTDTCEFVRRDTAEVFRKCIAQSDDNRQTDYHDAILDVLCCLANSIPIPLTGTQDVGPSLEILCEALKHQSKNTHVRKLLLNRTRLLQILSETMVYQPSRSASSDAAEALLHMSEDKELVEMFLRHDIGLVGALIYRLSDFSICQQGKNQVLKTLINCSMPIETRKLYARYPMLVQTLILATRSVSERSKLRSSLKSAIAVLVSEL